ncbi:hypothetical protein OROMI_025374 [Orobanche minor]
MKKGKVIEAELQLPEDIIQHIHSFLDGKEAAQTTLLSKSWYNAWLTRPNLDLDQIHFLCKSDSDFWKFVNNTVERYEKLNLKIDSLKLWISWIRDQTQYSLVIKLITKAFKRGATSLDFQIYEENNEFGLPNQVFGFENLTRLSVCGCKIGSTSADGKLIIRCARLESLTFKRVYEQGNILWDIISSCPLIENFSFSTTLRLALTEFGKGNVVDGRILVNEFRNLKRLFLYRVIVHPLYFDEFSSRFPSLKDLALEFCQGCVDIKISSPSLECISFQRCYVVRRVKFDVPRIRKLSYSGSDIPLLSFKAATTRNWESHICIERGFAPSAAWFLRLSKLLKSLSLSKVSLSLIILKSLSLSKFQGLHNKPKVENLTIYGHYSVCPAFFYSLFRCCHPIYVTQYWSPKLLRDGKEENDFMEFVCRRMMQQVVLNCCIAYQRTTVGECDLEEVSVEFYDESVSGWRPRVIDTSTSLGDADEHKIRLHLRWGR